MISRRNFLLGAGGGVAGIVALRFQFATPEHAIKTVLRRRLDYLKLEPLGIEMFARDLVARGAVATIKLRAFNAVGLIDVPLDQLGIHLGFPRRSEERIVTYYLLSTDFFITGADTTRDVKYLGFYDPLQYACRNPFPRSEPDQDSTEPV